MINFALCKKCPYGTMEPAEEGKDGSIEVLPAVHCTVGSDVHMLLMNSDPPKDCPLDMQHSMSTQKVPQEFADGLSGEKHEAGI